jgi:hypothetical protein
VSAALRRNDGAVTWAAAAAVKRDQRSAELWMKRDGASLSVLGNRAGDEQLARDFAVRGQCHAPAEPGDFTRA